MTPAAAPGDTLLGGLRVVETADHLTEHAGRILASMGAEVWLIEPPGGAWTRRRRPRVPGAEDSGRGSLAFLARNQNKRSIVVDPTDARALAELHGLIARADVVISAQTADLHDAVLAGPGDAARVTITDRLGLGRSPMVGFAAGGGMSSTGWPHQPPCAPPSFLTHDCAGIYAATMAVAAELRPTAVAKTRVRIVSVTPTTATASGPRRPTKKMSTTPNRDSIDISSTIGTASTKIARPTGPVVWSRWPPARATRMSCQTVFSAVELTWILAGDHRLTVVVDGLAVTHAQLAEAIE